MSDDPAGGYESPPRTAVDFTLAAGYTAPWPVDFTLEGPTAPPAEPPGLYRTVSVRFRRAAARSARPVDSRYAPMPRRERATSLRYGFGDAAATALASSWDGMAVVDVGAATHWEAGVPRDLDAASEWRAVPVRDREAATDWAAATPCDPATFGNGWGVVTPHDRAGDSIWERAQLPPRLIDPPPYIDEASDAAVTPRGDQLLVVLHSGADDFASVQLEQGMVYRPRIAGAAPRGIANFTLESASDWNGAGFRLYGHAAYAPPGSIAVDAQLPGAYVPPAALSCDAALGVAVGAGVVDPPPYVQMRSDPPPAASSWGRVPTREARWHLPWGAGSYAGRDPLIELPWVEPPAPPKPRPPALKVHIVLNEVSVTRLPDGALIEVLAVDLSANVDSWCWSVRMELADPSQAVMLQPDGNGPRMVQIAMNGYVWTAIIEGRERSSVFGQKTITVTGRSRTAVLDAPFAPRRSHAEANTRTAQQLALAELENTGFDLAWSGVDWLVPGGAWYYSDLTPMAVLNEIAGAAGAVVQSNPASATIEVRPRYPVAPWAWGTTTADLVLPTSWVLNDRSQYASKPMFDAVFVRGEQQGIQARITRQGSAGETFAEQVVHRLLTGADVAAQRGTAALADRGEQEAVELQIPLFAAGVDTGGESGLYLPLRLIEVDDVESSWKALSVGVTISARRSGRDGRALEILQNVSLERHLTDAG